MDPRLEQLDRLLERAKEYKVSTPMVFCINCGATNMKGAVECIECKEVFPQEIIEAA